MSDISCRHRGVGVFDQRGLGRMNEFNLKEIYVSNLMGLLLMMGVYLGNAWKMQKRNSEDKVLRGMIFTVMVSCIVDPMVYTVDGRPGEIFYFMNYVGNIWSFVADLIIGPLWIALIKRHVIGLDEKIQQFFVWASSIIGYGALLFNFIYPIIFRVDSDNHYHRGPLFWIFPLIGAMFILDGIVVYLIGRAKGSVLRFFPVMQFFVPVIIGVAVQIYFYNITMIWPGIAVGITIMILSLQNENIFRDKLTGLLNRFYLYRMQEDLRHQKAFGFMLLDINNFKKINEAFGHSEGDKALIAMAGILRKCVWVHGTVIRYSGDEFAVLLYADREEVVDSFKTLISRGIDDYNLCSGKDYKLSVSMGYGVFSLKTETMDDIMRVVDKRMFEEKKQFYESNPELERRHMISD